jgi:hypothetical protein
MSVPCKITLSIMDATHTPLVSTHTATPIPPSPAPAGVWPHMDIPVTQFWPPAFFKNKLTTTVKHYGFCIALDGQDCGNFIPHIVLGPPSADLALKIIGSSRSMNFSASSVSMNKKATASAFPFPMSTCAEPLSMPFTWSWFSLLSTVNVGLSVADILAGFASIIMTALIEGKFNDWGKNNYKGFGGKLFDGQNWRGALRNSYTSVRRYALNQQFNFLYSLARDGRRGALKFVFKELVDYKGETLLKNLKKSVAKGVADNIIRNGIAYFDGNPLTKPKLKLSFGAGGILSPTVEISSSDMQTYKVGGKTKLSPTAEGEFKIFGQSTTPTEGSSGSAP